MQSPIQYLGPTYTKILFTVYLKFKYNWVSSVLPGSTQRVSRPVLGSLGLAETTLREPRLRGGNKTHT